jgi:conjugal transfer/entry exclusion protein
MSRRILSIIFSLLLVLLPVKGQCLFGVGDIVYDPAAVAQLIAQIQKTIEMIDQLKNIDHSLEDLTNWQEIDHINLAGGKFGVFFEQYKKLFDDIMKEIEGYQGGGLMGKLEDLESRYPSYHQDWETQDEFGDPLFEQNPELQRQMKIMKKDLLLTRIQMKHALKVGGKVRESLSTSEEQTRVLLDDTAQAVGIMQSIKIGNQLTGMVSKSLQSLNVQMNEYLQAYTASELEKNQRKGYLATRAREAINGFGKRAEKENAVPLNPVGAF